MAARQTSGGFALRIGKPQNGQTVFVSAAAGAVGAIVCQIAKIKGNNLGKMIVKVGD